MAFSPSSPITGATVTGLTSPTYTLSSDTPPNAHSKQYVVSALGGTQTDVDTHSVSSPFTLTCERPANFKQLGKPNPTTGVISSVPRNVYTVRVRKGMVPLAGQSPQIGTIEVKFSIPAGADSADPANLRAMYSAGIGLLSQQSSGLALLGQDGVL